MSIATQIERLQNAKESIKQKLIEKGVEVSDDVKLDQYGELIDTIPSGGGESTLKKLLDATKSCYYLFYKYTGSSVDDLISYFDTENVTDFSYMFYIAKVRNIPKFDTRNGINFRYAFYNCSYLVSIPKLDYSKGTDFSNMLQNCNSLRGNIQLDLSSGTTFTNMFSTTTISSATLNTLNGTIFNDMFSGCTVLTSVSLNTSNGTNCSAMFRNCSSLTSVTGLDVSNATTIYGIFNGCTSLTNAPQLNLIKVTSGNDIFSGCTNLTSVSLINTGNIKTLSNTFKSCQKLVELSRLDTTKCTNFYYTFGNCYLLEKIDISYYNISNASSYAPFMCYSCYSLKALIIRSFGSNYAIDSTSLAFCYHILGTTNSTYNPNGDKDGYIYVPRNMVDTLKSATNWSVYADQIRALEDYTVDGTTTGDLDMDKVNAPSQQEGYNVNLDPDAYVPSNKMFYSLDNGTTWLDLISIKDKENPILTGVTQIKFKAKSTMLYCEELGMALEPMVGEEESENYTLSQDITISTM